MNARLERLEKIGWGSAPGWDPKFSEFVFDYYVRVFPVWPADWAKIMPHNSLLIEPFVARLSAAERTLLEQQQRDVLAAWQRGKVEPTLVVRSLLPLLLATSLLSDRGALAADDDPALPLLALFEAGYELSPSHAALDVGYAKGMTTVPLPSRSQIEAFRGRAAPHAPAADPAPEALLWFDGAREHFYLMPIAEALLPGPFELQTNDGQTRFVDLRSIERFEVSSADAKRFLTQAVDRFFQPAPAAGSPGSPPAPLFALATDLLQRFGSGSARDRQALLEYLQDLVGAFGKEQLGDALQRTAKRLGERGAPVDLEDLVGVVQALMDEELAAEPELKPGFADEVRAEARATINEALRRRGFKVDD